MKLNSPFAKLYECFGDAIYVLTLSNRQDRTQGIINQLRNIGMDNMNEVNFIYATPFPYNNLIANAFNTTKKGKFTKPNEYDCSRNHYSIVRQAYDRGYDKVLVIEDDVRFLNDVDLFIKTIDDMPKQADVFQFGGFSADINLNKYITDNVDGINWVEHNDVGLWTTSMYALSRKGMQFYLACMDKYFWVADGPLYIAPRNNKLVNSVMNKYPLVIQADKNDVSSDIRTSETDSIDYESENVYESKISKEKYFLYSYDK